MAKAFIKRRESLRRILKNLPEEERAHIKIALRDSAGAIVGTQKQLVPVDTGALRDSITATPGEQNLPAYASLRSRRATKDPGLAVIITAGNSGVRYAHLIEFGRERAAAQPFFYPGFRAHKREASRKIRKAARDAIKSALRKRRAA